MANGELENRRLGNVAFNSVVMFVTIVLCSRVTPDIANISPSTRLDLP